MDKNVHQNDEKSYMLGMISLVLFLALLLFSLYITPFLLLKLVYDVPSFVVGMLHHLHEKYHFTDTMSRWLVALFFFTLSFLFGLLTYFISKGLEGEPYVKDVSKVNARPSDDPLVDKALLREQIEDEKRIGRMVMLRFYLKMFSIIMLCVIILVLVHIYIGDPGPFL